MPIYEYRCQSCGHQLEKLQKISDQPLVECPECGQSALSKLISAAGFRLKGGGWYETDFKKGDKRNIAGDGKSEDKSDVKNASKDSKSDDKSKSSGSGKDGDTSKKSSSSGEAA